MSRGPRSVALISENPRKPRVIAAPLPQVSEKAPSSRGEFPRGGMLILRGRPPSTPSPQSGQTTGERVKDEE